MSATTAAVNPAAPPAPAPARTAADPASAADDNRFDRHLDAARQQHGDAQDRPAHEDGHESPSTNDPATARTGQGKPSHASAKDETNPDAAALAAAMLTLIGQAAPAKPLAQAGGVAAAPAKVAGTAGTVARQPAALMLLAGAAATAAAARPAVNLDTNALAPMLAKPSEQKDTPLDALQMAAASGAQPAMPTPANTAPPAPTLNIASPAGTPAFAQELGQHVVWLGHQDVKQARIRLHPEDLGTLDVKVSMNHDRVDVSFAVQHPAAVHAVQQTLPQLDALLAHHGLALGHADVGQRQQQGEGGRGGETAGTVGEIEPESVTRASVPVTALGMLDTFA
ncbi:flagellar hook-length control protein FliK [Frateuria terrea]|uniref:Flagellar hook-length control protein FliK n=1 Tax=Frateuria terrea TaxID=529704 RepID=A0A1H6VUS8_9GAMM|nr:flagellar hook-length control protein FliK [Frateuria terrea]SEJ08399.1 flagellar hook-length control protein FliK [Frateuria terrea]SFP69017.1 flagellar hook-length control protein FliK [Frateuria terrea]